MAHVYIARCAPALLAPLYIPRRLYTSGVLGCRSKAGLWSHLNLRSTRKLVTFEEACRYEKVGDSLAHQYGGSEAHSRFFQHQRGDWAAAMSSRDLVTSLRRFYSNAVTDAEKQHAMDLLLGAFVPAPGRPAIWELEAERAVPTGALLCNIWVWLCTVRWPRLFAEGSVRRPRARCCTALPPPSA